MRRKDKVISLMLAFAMLLSLAPAITANAEPGPNLLQNASFESPQVGTSSSGTAINSVSNFYWTQTNPFSGTGANNVRAKRVAGDAHTGSQYVDHYGTTNRAMTQTVTNVQPGTYFMEAYVSGTGTNTTYTLHVDGTTVQNSPRSAVHNMAANGVGSHTRIALENIVVTSVGSVNVNVTFTGASSTSWGALDDIYFGLMDVNEGLDEINCVVSQNGNASTPTTAITLNFDEPVPGLTASNITLDPSTAAVKGALTASNGNQTWTLQVSNVIQGQVAVSVTGIAGYKFAYTNQQITLYAEPVAYVSAAAAGSPVSNAITLTFDKSVTGLTAADITLTSGTGSATKGALTGSGANWSLAVSNVSPGTVTVGVANIPGFSFTPSSRQVTLVRPNASVTYTAVADGGAGGGAGGGATVATTKIDLTFSSAVTGLTANDILLSPSAGLIKGSLTGGGTNWSLALTAFSSVEGDSASVTVSITNNLDFTFTPASPGESNVTTVYKAFAEDWDVPVRQEVDFNANWKYNKGDATNAQNVNFDDSAWWSVGLPHSTDYTTYDFSTNHSGAGTQAYLGIYWYRKSITLPENLAGKQIYLHFGAAMLVSTVYVNGTAVGSHSGGWMGFTYDITNATNVQSCIINQTPIVIAVKCDSSYNSNVPPSRGSDPDFQFHSGLYRGATLTINEPVHITDPLYHSSSEGDLFNGSNSYQAEDIASGGVFIHSYATHSTGTGTGTPAGWTNANSNMGITSYQGTAAAGDRTGLVAFWIGTYVRNASTTAASSVTVKNELFEPGNDASPVWTGTSAATNIAAGSGQQIAMTNADGVPSAAAGPRLKLWHPNHPYLYTLVTSVYVNGELVDEYKTKTGFRNISFSNVSGGDYREDKIVINGENFVGGLGTDTHQEIGMVGFAVTEDAVRDEVRLIKDAGYDFVRLAHYPYQRAFIEACDEFGVMIQQPITGWQSALTSAAQQISYKEARDMIRRDRNSPSVVTWELCVNESSGQGAQFMTNMINLGRREFPTKQMITSGGASTNANSGYDIRYWHSGTTYNSQTGAYPAFYFEYGDWQYGGYLASTRHVRWNASEHKARVAVSNFQAALDKAARSSSNYNFYWVWQDYTGFGEANPDTRYPGNGSSGSNINGYPIPSGMVDMFRRPEYAYYYAQSQRNAGTKFYGIEGVRSGYSVYIATRWFDTEASTNAAGTTVQNAETANTDVPVYTNAPFVRIYGSVDGVSWTRIGADKTAPDTNRAPNDSGTTYQQNTAFNSSGGVYATKSRPWTFKQPTGGNWHQYTWIKAIGTMVAGDDPIADPSKAVAEYVVRDPSGTTAANIGLTWQSDWNSDGTKANPSRVRPLIANGGDKRMLYIDILDDKGMIKTNSGLVTTSSGTFASSGAHANFFNAAGLTGTNPVTLTVKTGDALLLGGDIAAQAGSSANTPGAPGFSSVTVTPRGGQVSIWVVAGQTPNDYIEIEATSPGLASSVITIGTVPKNGLWPMDVDSPEKTITDLCIARGKPATASSGDAALANDGDEGTNWAATTGNADEWWRVDLLNDYRLDDVHFVWGSASTYKYNVEYSRTGAVGDWQTLFDMTANAVSESETELTVSGIRIARYLRITFTSASDSPSLPFRIREVHINGELMSGDVQHMITGMDAWWGDPSHGLNDAAIGCDGDPATSTVAANNLGGNQWICDLGGVFDVTALNTTWAKDHAYKYKIEYSIDNKTWNTAMFNSSNTTQFNTMDMFDPPLRNARFLRLTSAPDTEAMSFNLMNALASDPNDLAYEKPTTASGANVSGNLPEYAVNGVKDAGAPYWEPDSPGQTLDVDLGNEYTVRAVRADWTTSTAREYAIQVSSDGVEWYAYWSGTADGDFDIHSAVFTGIRYVRLVNTDGAGLVALEVYGDDVAIKELALGANVIVNGGFSNLSGTSATNVIPDWSKLPDTNENAVFGNTRNNDTNNAYNTYYGSSNDRYAYFSNGGSPYSASMYQTVAGLPDGVYSFEGYVKRGPSGANVPAELYAYVEGYGDETMMIDLIDAIPQTSATLSANESNTTAGANPYTRISLPEVHVTSGKASIGFFINSPSTQANYLFMDEITFKLIALDPPKQPISYTNAFMGGVVIAKVGAEIIADYTVRNTTSDTATIEYILATYNARGALTSVTTITAEVEPNSVFRDSIIAVYDPDITYKAFLWNGKTYAPICEAATPRVISIDDVTRTIDIGESVVLPNDVTVRYHSGLNGADTQAVTWNAYGPFDAAGVVTVYGTVEGTDIRARAIITVKGANLFGNPSFSDGTTITTGGWTVSPSSGHGLNRATSATSDPYRTSPGGLRYWNATATGEKRFYQTVTLEPGTYLLGAWHRSDAYGNDTYFGLYASATPYVTDSPDFFHQFTATGTNYGYEDFTFEVTTTQSYQVGIRYDFGDGPWFQMDDFTLNWIGPVSP